MVVGQTGEHVDLVVVGSGPAGYSAAIRAGQLGRRVVLVERGALGGVCLNHGCVPATALLSAARIAHQARGAAEIGIEAEVRVDLARLQEWKRGVVARLSTGVRGLLDRAGVRVVPGTARFAGERRIAVEGKDAIASFLEFDAALIATGSRVEVAADAISPERALTLESLPESLIVLGGTYIAVEVAVAFARLGSAVTLLAPERALLPEVDEPLVQRAAAAGLRRLGVTAATGVEVASIADGVVAYQAPVGAGVAARSLSAAVVVDARRRVPNTDDLNLGRAGLRALPGGLIEVDSAGRTALHHVFAAGDITPGVAIAHRAIAQGRVAAEVACGLPAAFDPAVVPLAFFTEPEVAVAGLSERAAGEAGFEVQTARFPLAASGRALTLRESEGFVQIVAERDGGRVVGVQIAGPGATELINEAALAIEMTATLEDLALTLHAHPTLAESLGEAADLALGKPRHVGRRGE